MDKLLEKESEDQSVHRDIWNYPADHTVMGFCSNAFTLIRKERYDEAKMERDAALDALTVTQEEWLLRTKALEAKNYKLQVDLAVAIGQRDNESGVLGLVAEERNDLRDTLKKAVSSLEFVYKHIESMDNYSLISGARYHIDETLDHIKRLDIL